MWRYVCIYIYIYILVENWISYKIKLFISEKRRERGDFNQIDKIVQGLEQLNWRGENKIPDQKTIGQKHLFKLCIEHTSGNEPRTHFLLNKMMTPI